MCTPSSQTSSDRYCIAPNCGTETTLETLVLPAGISRSNSQTEKLRSGQLPAESSNVSERSATLTGELVTVIVTGR